MTLSARLAIVPSRRLASLAVLLAAGGVAVAASTLALRWPQMVPVLVLVATAACGAIVASARRRRAVPVTLSVSQHADFDVQPDPVGGDGTWRLAESTVVWPGFAMLALRPFDPSLRGCTVRLPVVTSDLAADDRRALGRFLVWSMHGGAGDVPRSPRR